MKFPSPNSSSWGWAHLCTRGLGKFSVFVKCVSTAGPKRFAASIPFCFIVEFPKTDQTQACRLTASPHMWNFQALTLLVEAGLTCAPVPRGLWKISQFGCLSNQMKCVSMETQRHTLLWRHCCLLTSPLTTNTTRPACPPDNKPPPALPCPLRDYFLFITLLKGGNKTKVLKKIILLRPLNLIILIIKLIW